MEQRRTVFFNSVEKTSGQSGKAELETHFIDTFLSFREGFVRRIGEHF